KREVVPAVARMPNKRDAKERLSVEGTNDEHRPIVSFTGAVELVADVDTDSAPPDLARVIEGPVSVVIDFLFVAVPTIEVFLHKCVRALYARCVALQPAPCDRSRMAETRHAARCGARERGDATAAGAQKQTHTFHVPYSTARRLPV